jgi:hypothetical protein
MGLMTRVVEMMVSEDMKVDGLIVRSGNEYGHADGNGHESEIRAFLRIRTLLEPAPVSLAFARVCRHLHRRPTLALDMALSVSRGPPSSSGAVACHSRRWLYSTFCQLDFKTISEDGRNFLPAERFFVVLACSEFGGPLIANTTSKDIAR